MRLKLFLLLLTVLLLPSTSAHAFAVQAGKYTFNAEGYGGDAAISPVQGAQGVFTLTAETFRESNGNMCSYSGTCITQGASLICTNPVAPEAIVTVQPVANGIELSGEDTSYFCGNNVFFTGFYISANQAASVDSGFKEEELEFLGYEIEGGVCGPLYANNLDDYSCLSFRRKDGNDVFMWRENALRSSPPTKRADLLVAYMANPKGNTYFASIAKPYSAPEETDEVVFIGEDENAPDGGAFMFKDSLGQERYLTCWSDFCDEMANHAGKKMEISYQDEYYYHEGGEAYVETTFVLGYRLLPQ